MQNSRDSTPRRDVLRLPQDRLELAALRGVIEDAERDTVLWLQVNPSAEERVYVIAIQAGLADLHRTLTHRLEDRASPDEDQKWTHGVRAVLSSLQKARDARGNFVGKSLAGLGGRLVPPPPPPRTKAPRPPTPLRRTVHGITLTRPELTQIPPDFPPDFPDELKPQAAVILAEAVRKFPEQKQALEMCKHVISEMTPLFRAAVEAGTVRANQVLSDSGVGGLLHSLLVYNCDRDSERYRLEQEARRSDEWLKLAKGIADVAEGYSGQREAAASTKRSRLSATINCPIAARRMEAHLRSKGMSQTTFASHVGTTDRTLRSFRQTGKVRRDIFDAIAKEMGTTTETLLKPE